MGKEEEITVTKLLGEIVSEMCDHYCKYRDVDVDENTGCSKYCENCPFDKMGAI